MLHGQVEHDPWFAAPPLVRQHAREDLIEQNNFRERQVVLIQAFSRRRAARLIFRDMQNVHFCPFESRNFYYTTLLNLSSRGSKDGSVDTRVHILERIIKLKALC